MQATVDGPTSGTIANPASPRFAQDQQTRTWVLSGTEHASPLRDDVLNYAQRELASLRRLPRGWDGGSGIPLRPGFANMALVLVGLVTADHGLATPQFSPLPDGGVGMTWLVGGDRLTINVDPWGICIRGVWRSGLEAFVFEPEVGSFLLSELEGAINEARGFLLKISTRVQHQLLTT
jgi:hypothetical protein